MNVSTTALSECRAVRLPRGLFACPIYPPYIYILPLSSPSHVRKVLPFVSPVSTLAMASIVGSNRFVVSDSNATGLIAGLLDLDALSVRERKSLIYHI